jgi:hypothetical protein
MSYHYRFMPFLCISMLLSNIYLCGMTENLTTKLNTLAITEANGYKAANLIIPNTLN